LDDSDNKKETVEIEEEAGEEGGELDAWNVWYCKEGNIEHDLRLQFVSAAYFRDVELKIIRVEVEDT
jgi:hypothetical protein